MVPASQNTKDLIKRAENDKDAEDHSNSKNKGTDLNKYQD